MFQQLLVSKHHRLRDSKFGGLVADKSTKKKEARVNHELRSAHGRVVKNTKNLL